MSEQTKIHEVTEHPPHPCEHLYHMQINSCWRSWLSQNKSEQFLDGKKASPQLDQGPGHFPFLQVATTPRRTRVLQDVKPENTTEPWRLGRATQHLHLEPWAPAPVQPSQVKAGLVPSPTQGCGVPLLQCHPCCNYP